MTMKPITITRRRLAATAAAAAAALGLAGPAAEAAVPHHGPAALGARLQRILDRAVEAPGTPFPGVALDVRVRGQRRWSGAAGLANVDPVRPMRADDRFRAGSIMKPFIAVVTLQLVEQGRVSLDDPLTAVLPANVTSRFAEAGHITVRMLLDHTSGIGEYVDDGFNLEVLADPLRRWRTAELLDRAAAQPRTGAPGERFAYSNTDYTLLGLVVERVTGRSWRTVVEERVIRRLRLRHTSLPRPGHLPSGRDIAHGYELVDGALRDVTDVDSSMAGAAGGHALLTTTADLTRFMRAVLAGKLFHRRQTLAAMRTFVPARDEHGRVGYGLGLERYVLPGGIVMIGHLGTTAGYRALTFRLPAQRASFTMVTNQPGDPMPVLGPVLRSIAATAR